MNSSNIRLAFDVKIGCNNFYIQIVFMMVLRDRMVLLGH